jgi:protein-S-isoprenylcysteine O-methyltransferase Ste14
MGQNLGVVTFFMFVFGILLMIISEGVDIVFGTGLLLFIIALIIVIFQVVWSIAGKADEFTRRHW